MNIKEKLLSIQTEIEVPKTHYNSFGNYNYRNAEDILNAVKPLCKKYNCFIGISDELLFNNGICYIEATAYISDCETEELSIISSKAYARETPEKKKMSSEQLTGSAGSYAHKYALSGLLALDDVEDSDSRDNTQQPKPKPQQPKVQVDEIIKKLESAPKDKINSMIEYWNSIKSNYTTAEINKVDTFIEGVLK